MEVKIITTIEEAKALEFGEQYIVQPKGMDLQKPGELHKHSKKITQLNEAVEQAVKVKMSKEQTPKKKVK